MLPVRAHGGQITKLITIGGQPFKDNETSSPCPQCIKAGTP